MIFPSKETLVNRLAQRFQNEGINASAESSVARALSLGIADIVSEFYTNVESENRKNSVRTATGEDLDKIGEFQGVFRLKPNKSTTVGSGPGVLFRNNSSVALSVPLNTGVFPSNQPEILYRTLFAISVPAYGSAQVDVQASGLGQNYNVGVGTLNSHNQGSASLVVVNPRALTSGSDGESDDSYRSRIYKSRELRNPGSRESIRQNLATLPGVRDCLLNEGVDGPGTLEVMLVGQSGEIPQESFIYADEYLQEHAPLGITWRLRVPRQLFVDVDIENRTASGLNGETISAATQAVRAYIDSLGVEDGNGEGTLIYSELQSRVATSLAGFNNRINFSLLVYVQNVPLPYNSDYVIAPGERLTSRRVKIF